MPISNVCFNSLKEFIVGKTTELPHDLNLKGCKSISVYNHTLAV